MYFENFLFEIFPFIRLVTILVSTGLAVVLVYSITDILGKRWLFASVLLKLCTWSTYQIIDLIGNCSRHTVDLYDWYGVINLVSFAGIACFGMFLFIVWSHSHMTVNAKEILFSFQGRIPRSVFWIISLLLFPLGVMIGLAPLVSDSVGAPRFVILAIYLAWTIVGTWISLAVYAKRWHDCSKSGWTTLVLFIPVIGVIFFTIYLGFVKGTPGANPYGEDPLYCPET